MMNISTSPKTATAPLLSVRDLRCSFKGGTRSRLFGPLKRIQAVNGVSFDVLPGEAFGIVGESGCGKSTTAKLILNMANASAGSVRLRDQELLGLDDSAWKPLRRKLQYVFQDPLGALDPRMRVLDQVIEPLCIHQLHAPATRRRLAAELLQSVGLQPGQHGKYPHELSGGQRQRVVLARALILQPELLICDEPISALDVSIQAQIVNLLQSLRRELGLTLLFISHDLSVVHHLCDRVAVMYLGRIVETGPARQLFSTPRHPYTQALVSAIPHTAQASPHARIVLTGEPPSPAQPPDGCAFHPRCAMASDRCRQDTPALTDDGTGQAVACFEARLDLREVS
ncbi:ABC transporter ATP-binding protein [Marinobacterium nitratireducens]|uniref:ABC transporter ATP-binding protein n=1 Tax=Marinobacterium nitratireducens TaxID=518897 RepID=A0A917ZKA7_9GAMM|nr:oligopeptide/dipeptide ABC transporter ATP-binding protein [Marinobacterium nitratireducens]GGO84223.1 ABC transporter ATP-binding protein [Marinobacterium nitratireducens]